MKRQLFVLIVAACVCGTALADDFYPISSVSSSTGASDLWPASNLIQGPGVGFNADEPYEKLVGGADGNWVTDADAGFPADYIEQVGMPVLTFDLGSDVPLNEISVWGYESTNSNGVSQFSLSFATDAEGPDGGSASAGPFDTIGDVATGENDSLTRQSFSFDAVTARYVNLTVTDNYFNAPGDGSVAGTIAGGDRAGLGEVAFQRVPEPSSCVLLVLGALAMIRSRR